jgi:hypothetical protein
MQPTPLQYESSAADARGLAELPAHNGQPRPKPVQFFASPPPEIGHVVSAESTVALEKHQWSLSARCALAVLAGIVALAIFIVGGITDHAGPDEMGASVLLGITAAVVSACAVLYVTRLKGICTFIGTRGIARLTRSSLLGLTALPKCEALIFDRAAELRASQTMHYAMGAIYTGSTFDYAWFDGSGTRIFRIEGGYHVKKPDPKQEFAWHLAEAAEMAWSEWYYAHALNVLKQTGAIPFRIDSKRSIQIGNGFLEFHFDGVPAKLTREEIGSVSLRDGQFTFKNTDAKWYSSAGKYSFPYGKMANAKVFLMAMEKLMGYRWG